MPHYYPEHTDEPSLPQVGETVAAYSLLQSPNSKGVYHRESVAVGANRNLLLQTEPATEGETFEQRFERLYQQWWRETCISSDYAAFTRHPAFSEIVKMGEEAVPLIVEKLRYQPSFLVKALNRIYKQRISPDKKTTIVEACNLWIKKLGL